MRPDVLPEKGFRQLLKAGERNKLTSLRWVVHNLLFKKFYRPLATFAELKPRRETVYRELNVYILS